MPTDRIERSEGLRVFAVTAYRGGVADVIYNVVGADDQSARQTVVDYEKQVVGAGAEPIDYCNISFVCTVHLIVKGQSQ